MDVSDSLIERDREYERKRRAARLRYYDFIDPGKPLSRTEDTLCALDREEQALARVYADVLKWRARRDRGDDREQIVAVLAGDVFDALRFAGTPSELDEILREAVERARQMYAADGDQKANPTEGAA